MTIDKTIVFCVNNNGTSNISINFLKAWTELCCKCISNNIMPVLSINGIRDEYLNFNKSLGGKLTESTHQKIWGIRQYSSNGELIKEESKIKCDYVCFIDSSMNFKFSHLMNLMSINREFVSAVYNTTDKDTWSFCLNWDMEKYLKDGLIPNTKKNIPLKSRIMEVVYTDIKAFLIKPELLDDIEYPWFSPHFEILNNGTEYTSSISVSFCQKLINKGKILLVDSGCYIENLSDVN